MRVGLQKVVQLIELASDSVAKLMASVSLPPKSHETQSLTFCEGFDTQISSRSEVSIDYPRTSN